MTEMKHNEITTKRMSTVLLKEFEKELDSYYQSIASNINVRECAEKYYAIIGIKRKNKDLERFIQPLYLDIKHFVKNHLDSFDTEDYGYDIPNNEKLLEAIESLPVRERLAMCRYAYKQYESYGYETDFLEDEINKLKMKIAWNEKRFFSFLLCLSAHNLWTLIVSYLLFLIVVFVVLLPAPNEWMGVLWIEPYEFDAEPIKNHLMNTMALAIGGDYAPKITPTGLKGMFLVIIGNVLFYLLIGNYVVKKLSDLFSIE